MRVWYLAQVAPGLAMSRSIGDAVGAMVGVTAEPEVSQVVLGPEASFVLVCSDGIWEFLESRGAAGKRTRAPNVGLSASRRDARMHGTASARLTRVIYMGTSRARTGPDATSGARAWILDQFPG